MGRHTRDDEPVPHPQDRAEAPPTGGRPPVTRRPHPGVARRGEASGAFPVTGRPAGRRGEASAPFPVARRDETAAERTEVITRHGEASGNYPITARGETSGAFRTAGPGENTGSHRTLDRPE